MSRQVLWSIYPAIQCAPKFLSSEAELLKSKADHSRQFYWTETDRDAFMEWCLDAGTSLSASLILYNWYFDGEITDHMILIFVHLDMY
jgi:hypothetical protein